MFDGYGPSCYVQGACPEGRMCCGKQEEMKEKYLPERVKNSNLGIGNIEKDTIPSKDVKPKK